MNLTPKDREIAIQAIAARATGSPAEAAKQILMGIRTFDGELGPFVVWPVNPFRNRHPVSYEERAAWHESQAAKLREWLCRNDTFNNFVPFDALWAERDLKRQQQADERLASSDHQDRSGLLHERVEEAFDAKAQHEAKEAGALPLGQKPAQEASDASQ